MRSGSRARGGRQGGSGLRWAGRGRGPWRAGVRHPAQRGVGAGDRAMGEGLGWISSQQHNEYKAQHKEHTLVTALYADCSYHEMLYMQSVHTISCFTCKVSVSCSALHAKCPYYLVLYVQSVCTI